MTPISEIIFSGFVSKVVNDLVDVSKDKVRKAVRNKSTEHQNLESQIYNVIVDVLNQTTGNQYEDNQDKIFDAAYALLKLFKENKGDNLGNIQSCLRIFDLNADENECLEFKISLYEKLGRDEYSQLFRAILLLLLEQKNQYDYIVYEQLNQKLDEVELKVDKLNQKLDDAKNYKNDSIVQDKVVKFQNNKKQDYIKNWNSRLFLHIDNDEKPITLADAFIMPDFDIYCSNTKIGISKNDTFEQTIEHFINYDRTSTMLITGVPGIGKTSITAWIANEYKDDDRFIILRFRDWNSEELEEGIVKAICNTLKCAYSDLNNKILILDGFDELKLLNIRENLLNRLFGDILDWENIKLIITSRPAYITFDYFQNVVNLKKFSIDKIEIFYEKIKGYKLANKEKIKSNLEVLGIPVILYMAIMSDVDISENPTKPELYNRIFAEKGGIFDKFCVDGIGYDKGSHLLRNNSNIRKYLKFLREIAFKMFEKNKLFLSKGEYAIPKLKFQGREVKVLEFPIKYLFDNIDSNLEFIHKSIYEYFVVEYIYMMINSGVNKADDELAAILGDMLKGTILSHEILEFLEFKIKSSEESPKFCKVYKTFQTMLLNGMTFYTDKKYQNIIQCEINVFCNMLEILHFWEDAYMEFNRVIQPYLLCNIIGDACINLKGVNLYDIDLQKVDLKNARLEGTNLKRVKLEGIKLDGASLQEADLEGANLKGANLKGANLKGANLKNTDLCKADLEGADLQRIDLAGANLRGIDLERANLKGANLRNVFLGDANVQKADLREINLEKANMMRANMIKANLEKANLKEAKMIGAKMICINLERANLKGTDLEKANLVGANLKGANLRNANLRGTDLKESDLTGANLEGAILEAVDLERANLRGTDLRGVCLQGALMSENDIAKIQLQLRQARFTYIMIKQEDDIKQIYRSELFSDEK